MGKKEKLRPYDQNIKGGTRNKEGKGLWRKTEIKEKWKFPN
jgi:hypothetical protein